MKATPLAIPEVVLLEPRVFGDARGFFFESFNQAQFEAAVGCVVNFVQDNHSRSAQNVLRGLHYQVRQPQAKLIRVTAGAVFDVASIQRLRKAISSGQATLSACRVSRVAMNWPAASNDSCVPVSSQA